DAQIVFGALQKAFAPTPLSMISSTSFQSDMLARCNVSVFNPPQSVANAAPTIATPASASPLQVSGATAAVAVLGADDSGEAMLTYTWAATGPALVTFSPNGSNAAKLATAMFS